MSSFVQCPFCHESIHRSLYAEHQDQHTRRLDDGQMSDHITVAPEGRYQGSLEHEPQSYYHQECDAVTGMPEDIIRSYLVNPLLYNDTSFCCGCGEYIHTAELTWVETGEDLLSYSARMRSRYLREVMGIDPRGAEIVVTPPAFMALRRLAREKQLEEPWFLSLGMIRDGKSVDYSLDVCDVWDIDREDLIELEELGVLVPRSQRKRLKGTLVHYDESGPGSWFTVVRLRPWQ